jgi:hypothetical protein
MKRVISPKARLLGLSDTEKGSLARSISETAIEVIAVDSLNPYQTNVKRHPQDQIERLAESIRTFGFTQPILIDSGNGIIAGHGRWEAAKLLRLGHVPAIRLAHLSEHQRRGLRIADNKLAELGSWNLENLALELKELTSPALELDFDASVLGFDTVEIDQILEADRRGDRTEVEDEIPKIASDYRAVSETGDTWICGPHRLYCGDAQQTSSYETLLQRDRAQIVFTDPPYNVPNQGHVTKRTTVREFKDAGT